MSNWLDDHLSSSGGRYVLLPFGGMSNEAISSFIPEISSVQLPNSIWNEVINSKNTNLTFQSFSQGLSMLGVEYIVINKGPYVAGDPASSFTGNARIYPSGFPWDLSYIPAGSWQNWSKLFRNDSYLKPVLSNENWLVLQNTLFVGLFHVYLFPHNFNMSNITSTTGNGSILYYVSGKMTSLNFSIPQHNAFSENWSESIGTNGSIYYNGGPLPPNMSYSNIWDIVSLKNSTYYDLSYLISGKNMSQASIDIRFYSGPNMSGNIVATYVSPLASGNLTNKFYNYNFNTPKGFNSSAIFLTYFPNPYVKFYNYTFHICSFKYESESIPLCASLIRGYHDINPTKLSLMLNLSGNSTDMILYPSTFNPAWSLRTGNITVTSSPFSVFQTLKFNSFVVNEKISNAVIYFNLQRSHSLEIIYDWVILFFYGSLLFFVVFLYRRRKSNGSR